MLVEGNFGMNINEEDGDEMTPLNKVDGTMKNAQTNGGFTPLMCAALGKNSSIVRFLLEQGANPKVVNKIGWNILHFLCAFGDLQGNHLFIFT